MLFKKNSNNNIIINTKNNNGNNNFNKKRIVCNMMLNTQNGSFVDDSHQNGMNIKKHIISNELKLI